MRKLIMSTLVSLGIAGATVPLAFGQTTSPADAGPQGHHEPRHQHEKRPFSLPSERVEARLAYIKTALKITDAQQSQWNAYAEVLRKQAREMDQRIQSWQSRRRRKSKEHEPTAIDRLQRAQEFLAAASAKLSELLAVEKPLYAALTRDQQLVADEVLPPRRPSTFHREDVRRGAWPRG